MKSKGVLSVQFPLLNAGHPLIAYAERAIKELGVQEYYKNWRFPWYVPKSAASFSRVLTQAGFMDVRVIPESNRCVFDSPEEVYRHFISVGLELYAARFPGEMRDMFMDSVKQNIQRDFPQAVTLKYERLFASGKK